MPVTKRTYVTGIEFHPGNARVVHHANIRIDRTPATRRLDEADPLPGYDGLMPRSAEYPDGHFLGWTPGQIAPLVQPELAWTLEPGSDLVVQLHMQPTGAAEDVWPEIGFYFTDRPPLRDADDPAAWLAGHRHSAGRAALRDSRFVRAAGGRAAARHPAARALPREGDPRRRARCPTARRALVMHIKDWDFRWQHVYREETPIPLPKGTRLSMEYTYDNSASNVRNPELPPARVFWGQRSRDEMGDLWFQLLASNDADRARMSAEITAKMTGEDIVGYETMLKVTPNDAELHDDVALLYLGMGFAANAVRHFQASAAIKPESAAAHFNLGTALAQAGRFDDSIKSFRDALSRRPDYALAHGNLGRVLLVKGDVAEALKHFQEAVRLDPNNPQSLLGLAEALAAARRLRSGDRDARARDEAAADREPREGDLREARALLISETEVA